MQLLTFTIGGSPYAIESRRIVEVLPLIVARPLPHVPAHVRGLFTYRGSLVPLVDLSLLLGREPSAALLSTRVIVVSLGEEAGVGLAVRENACQLGLVAEHVIAIRAIDTVTTAIPQFSLPSAPYLGRILGLGSDTVQLLDVDLLLSEDLRRGLFPSLVPESQR